MKDFEERLDFIEFRQDLLFSGTNLDRLIYELKITRNQYEEIIKLMEGYREKIDNNEPCSSATFETEIARILPEQGRDYHVSELLTKEFMEEGRWEEVFFELYGKLPKYSNITRR